MKWRDPVPSKVDLWTVGMVILVIVICFLLGLLWPGRYPLL